MRRESAGDDDDRRHARAHDHYHGKHDDPAVAIDAPANHDDDDAADQPITR
jgi:hypothetical protein